MPGYPYSGSGITGKPFKACFIQIDIKDIVDLLAFDDQGRTYFALYSKNGSNLVGTDMGPVISGNNIFEATKNLIPDEVLRENMDNFANEETGSMTFSSGGVKETLCYVPVEGTGWEIAVLIYERVILDQIRGISEKNLEISRKQILFTMIVVLLLATVLLFELRALSKERLEAEQETSKTFHKMANTDALTGVRNKHAYAENETDLNEQLKNSELDKLAVVVCDINGLKHVNDTKGHEAGDRLIRDACALICEYFTHGSVFRIGGDEFAVLLQGKGYDTMAEVISELNSKIEENLRDGSVVVAIGSSVLEEKDEQVRDVFVRAGQMMYERKKN